VKLLLEKKSSQKVLMFKELTRELIKEHIAGGGIVWKNKKGDWIFYQNEEDLKIGIIWIHYNRVWLVFQTEFNMSQQHIRYFTKKRLWLDKKIRVNEVITMTDILIDIMR
jgi:hypothetical protein